VVREGFDLDSAVAPCRLVGRPDYDVLFRSRIGGVGRGLSKSRGKIGYLLQRKGKKIIDWP